jgi:hypothetical protein
MNYGRPCFYCLPGHNADLHTSISLGIFVSWGINNNHTGFKTA